MEGHHSPHLSDVNLSGLQYPTLSDVELQDEARAPVGIKAGTNLSPFDIKASVDLTSHILKHYNQLKIFEAKLKEIQDLQGECINGLVKENSRYNDLHKAFNFAVMFKQVSLYTKKLQHIRNDMVMIQERTGRLKHRATLVKEYQDLKVKQLKEAKALHEERERLLTAKPVWETSQNNKSQDKT